VLKEAASVTDPGEEHLLKGVELDYCRYPYVLGYEPILTNDYLQQYGIDPKQEITPEGQHRWNRFKADVMTEFMEDVRQELAGQQIAVRIPHDITASIYSTIGWVGRPEGKRYWASLATR
jgi:hypothetical protein